ncbi:MAG: type VI secretion system accessory protein TagJ, partial [Pirellula sp.]
FIPTRYVDSQSQIDDHVRLGWKTVWNQVGEGTFVGLGQRILATDADEYSLTSIQKLEFRHE